MTSLYFFDLFIVNAGFSGEIGPTAHHFNDPLNHLFKWQVKSDAINSNILLVIRIFFHLLARYYRLSWDRFGFGCEVFGCQPHSWKMTTKFMGIMVIKIGSERRLSKPLHFGQKAFLMALGIKPSWLIKPQSG